VSDDREYDGMASFPAGSLFEFEEKSTGCPQCGRPVPGDACLWCHPLNTKPKVIARRGGPATSKAAAAGIAYRTGSQKASILALYGQAREDGLTDEEVASFLGWVEVNKARKRCSDLRNEGMIEPVDGGSVTRVGKSGMANLVCAITIQGVATLTSMKEPHARKSDPVPVPTHGSHPAGYCGRRDCLICESDPFSEDAR
jgi:hypothetical protein